MKYRGVPTEGVEGMLRPTGNRTRRALYRQAERPSLGWPYLYVFAVWVCCGTALAQQIPGKFSNPQRVTIAGYEGEAMEP